MIVWKLDALLRQRRVKGREIARQMGIGENYLSRVRHEVPDRLSLTLLDSLCQALDCTIADLLEYVPGQAPAAEATPEAAAAMEAAPVEAAASDAGESESDADEGFEAVVAAALATAFERVPAAESPAEPSPGAALDVAPEASPVFDEGAAPEAQASPITPALEVGDELLVADVPPAEALRAIAEEAQAAIAMIANEVPVEPAEPPAALARTAEPAAESVAEPVGEPNVEPVAEAAPEAASDRGQQEGAALAGVPAEPRPEVKAGAAVIRTGALQAKLARLKERRPH